MSHPQNIIDQHVDFSTLPPSAFDFADFDDADAVPGYAIQPTTAAVVPQEMSTTRQAVKIARAVSGASELRLLVEKCEGKVDQYILETAQLQPYAIDRTSLKKGNKPLTAKAAMAAFEKKIAVTYPAETLRNKLVVARHINLL